MKASVTGTLTPVVPLAEGDHDLSYTLTDIAGNESLPSDPIQVIVDTKAPTQPTAPTEYVDNVDPVQGTFASGTTTNDTTPSVIVGTLPVDEKPTLYVDGDKVDSVYDPVAGTLTPVTPLAEGEHDLSYTLTDIAGNESLPSDPIQVIVDTKAPTQPTAPTEFVDNVGSIQGDFASGSATDDTTPSVIVGTLPADEKPTLYVDGKPVDSIYDPAAGTLTPVTPLAEGEHDFSYTLTDIAGNESLPSDPIQVIVDTKAPTQPTAPTEFVDNVGSKQGDFTTGTTTDDTTPSVIVGALPADEKPTLYVDGKPVDSVYDPVAGTLTPVNPMSEGDHAISYTLTDIAGNESAASDPILVKVDTTAPTALINIKTYNDDVGSITGDFNKNTKTDDTAPVLNIKVNGTINTDEVVQIYRDGKYIGDATLVKGNNYQFADSGLVDGKTYNYTARVVDAAGNYGEFNGNFKITIDTTAPNQPNAPTVYIDNVDPIQGTFASGDITNDTTPSIIIGALNADEIPNLYVDGQKVDSIYDATTNTLTPVNPLDEGTHHMSYSLSDETGNESAPSDPIVIIVDITPPDQPATPTEYIDDVGMFQGHLGTGTSTDDTTPSVIVGILPADEKPTLYVDGKAVDAIYDPVAGTLTPVLPLVEGDHALSYTLTDIAGNESLPSGAINIQIDTTKPIIDDLSTSFKLAVDTADGVAVGYTSTITATNNDLITRDNTLGQISGVLNRSLVQGEMLQISKDGGLTWEDVTSIQGANWTYQDNDVHAVDATVEFSFRVRDDVGNYTYLAGQEKSVQIDLTGPNGISLKPNVASQIVSGVKYTFTSAEYGLAEPGTKIALVNDVNNNGMWQEGIDTVVSYATVDANGQWSITTNIPKGDQNLAFLVWDKAGNVSTLSPITHVTSDDKVTPPTTGGPGAEVIVTKWGGTTDGDGYGVNCAAVTVNADGTYSFWQSVRGTTNSTCTTTANAGRVYSGVDLENYSAAYLAQASKANGAGYNLDNCCYGQFVSSAVFADINRDGNADVMSQLSSYGNCGYTAYWMNNGDGTYSSKALNQGVLNHLGGVIAYDRTGDGYLDFVIADSCSDSITFIKNNASNLTYETSTVTCSGNGMPQSAAMTIYNGLKTGSITGTAMPKDLSILHDVAGVDLDNNGTIDIVAHVDYNGKVLYGDCSRGMGIMYNSGTSAGFTYVNQANVFTSDGGTDYGNLQQSIVFADYNGDGWLDMFISRGTKAGVDSNESRIYLNDGKGQLNATDSQALWFGDKLSGGSAFAIDWNLDGKQDLIEVPAQVTGCYIKTGFAPTLYLNYGNNVWGKDAYALTPSTYTDITGATAVDYNWDGSVDLLLYRAGSDAGVVSSTNSAPTILIKNTNVAADGTSLHVKILDGQGINSYYGNTVKLYDSKGNLVSTQVLNPQSSGSTDSTGIVNFYGLDPNETYSIQLLRISNGVADNVGGIDNLGGYANKTINSSWTGLIAGKANEAYVLLAESDTATNNSGSNASGVVGTGYNDHFYGSLGNDHYNGGGGWETGANGKQVWVANGGEDILDYSNLQGPISINVATGTVTKVINGITTIDTFENIEQFVGAKGDTVFTGNDTNHVFVGGAGNDTFNLGSTASDTIYFNLLNPKDPTGGNGTDTVNGFHVGKVGTDQNADIIDIHELLDNYKGTAGLYTDVDSVKLDIASSGLKNYLQITDDGTNTYISVDLNGTGHNYATVLTLHDVKTDLETLLLNNQIVI
ncbi:Ig-like domain-containing protein [Acinetobacter gerneri]|uniref:Ig-like domain-containing protein n=1 Tax=Acinetobacter gerneri TaxID=202952 RepID=UPI003A8C3912